MKKTTNRLIILMLASFLLSSIFPLMGSGSIVVENDESADKIEIDDDVESVRNITIPDPWNFDTAVQKSQPLVMHYGISAFPAATGEYANETHLIFVGMEDLESRNLSVTVKVNISNETNVIVQENVTSLELCDECGGLTFLTFFWNPSREGTYHINTSYNSTGLGGSVYYGGENITVAIANITSYNAEIVLADDTLEQDDILTAWIIVNNTGNQIHDFGYNINITKAGKWDYGESISTGLLEHIYDMDEHNHTLTLLMEEDGEYTITVTFDHDGDTVWENFSVRVFHGTVNGRVKDAHGENVGGANLTILNATGNWFNDTADGSGEYSIELPLGEYEISVNATGYEDSPNWTFNLLGNNDYVTINFTLDLWKAPIVYTAPTLVDQTGFIDARVGNEIVIKVIYYDTDGDIGDVRIRLDAWNDTDKDMTKWSWEEGIFVRMKITGDNWTDGVNFTYTIDTLVNMTYRYTFKANDPVLDPVITTPVEFTVKAALPTSGVISGMVTSGTGSELLNISEAKVIIYYVQVIKIMHENTITAYDNITHWFNITTGNGRYTKTLAFNNYNIYVEHDGHHDVPEGSFTIDLIHLAVTRDFVLIKKEPVIPTFKITGKVVPEFATVKQGNNIVNVDNFTGMFEVRGLSNDSKVILTFSAVGYITHTKTVNINESKNVNIGTVTLHPVTYTIPVGPFMDEDKKILSNVRITIKWSNVRWVMPSDTATGIATFTNMPWPSIPTDAIVTVEHMGKTKTIDPNDQDDLIWNAEEEGNIFVWAIIIIMVALIVIVMIVLLVKKKKPEATGVDIELERSEENIGGEFGDDMEALKEEDADDEYHNDKEVPGKVEVLPES